MSKTGLLSAQALAVSGKFDQSLSVVTTVARMATCDTREITLTDLFSVQKQC